MSRRCQRLQRGRARDQVPLVKRLTDAPRVEVVGPGQTLANHRLRHQHLGEQSAELADQIQSAQRDQSPASLTTMMADAGTRLLSGASITSVSAPQAASSR